MVQWVRLHAPSAGTWVPSLGRELEPHAIANDLECPVPPTKTQCSQIDFKNNK